MNNVLIKKLNELPTNSGVYIMKDEDDHVIYVGKAKVLKNRVRQYFRNNIKDEKVRAMVSHISDFNYIITSSESDAFILENNLIKQYKPFYNIMLKDDKHYPYIAVNLNDKYPAIISTRKLVGKQYKYYGPYPALGISEIMDAITSSLKIRDCKLNMNKIPKNHRPCLNYYIGKCLGPCIGAISEEEYNKEIKKLLEYLNGNDESLINSLYAKMEEASNKEDFEKALKYKNNIITLERLSEKRVSDLSKDVSLDLFSYVTNGASSVIVSMIVRNGKLVGVSSEFVSKAIEDPSEILSSYIFNKYKNTISCPKEILVNLDFDYSSLIEALYNETHEKVNIISPKKGPKYRLIDMSIKNGLEAIEKNDTEETRKYNRTIGALEILKKNIKLDTLPIRMECYDISNTLGTYNIASMTVFINGEKAPKHYRRFKIRTVEGPNDFESMKEVLRRRLTRLIEKDDDISFGSRPDLIVIDGGKGQLSSAKEVMNELKLDIPLISLAKKFEWVYKEEEKDPYIFEKSNLGLLLLMSIRDEAHRFGITYHRELRDKGSLKSKLNDIDGVGDIRQKALIKHFKTIENIKKASIEEIEQVESIDKKTAQKVFEYFKKDEL